MTQGRLILERFEPLGKAGSGGFATVYIAWDPRIQRKVAIKVIPLSEADALRVQLPGGVGSTADRWHGVQPWSEYLAEDLAAAEGGAHAAHARWDVSPDDMDGPDGAEVAPQVEPVSALAHLPGLDEARTAAKLQDPRIVGVFDFEVRDQVAYLIMEYVEGITLTRLLDEYEDYLTLDVVAAVFDAVSGALTAAHKAGVLHLDIKPDNILINAQGQVKVTDFGLATLADAAGTGMAGGGTIGYMPLEQMRREPLDVRTDEWSLAAVTYEMLSGDNPFHAANLDEAQKAIEDAEVVLPSLCWESIDDQIDDVIFYALDPDPGNRYATVADFAEEVDKFLGDAAQGERQLAAIVADAIGAGVDDADSERGYDDYGDFDDEYGAGFDGGRENTARYGGGLQEGARNWLAAHRERRTLRRDGGFDNGDAGDFGGSGRGSGRGKGGSATDRESRGAGETLRVVCRVVVAAAAALATGIALSRLTPIGSLVGMGRLPLVSLASALVVALVTAFFPHVGVLVAGLLSGFYLVFIGHTIIGAAVAFAAVAWCYAYYRLVVRSDHPVWAALVAAVLVALLAALVLYLR